MKSNPVKSQSFFAIHLFKYKNSQVREKAQDIIKQNCPDDWQLKIGEEELLVLNNQDSIDLYNAIVNYRPDKIINGADYDKAIIDAYKQKAIKIDLTNARDSKQYSF